MTPRLQQKVDRLVDEAASYPLLLRVPLAALLLAVTAVFSWSAWALSDLEWGWGVAIVIQLLLQPLALFGCTAALYLLVPTTAVGGVFAQAMRRTIWLLAAWVVLFVAAVTLVLGYLAFDVWW